MISWIVLTFAVTMFVFGAGTGIHTYSWAKDAQSVTGTVVELVAKKSSSKRNSKRNYAPRVRYRVNGEEREFVSSQSSSSPDFRIGQEVLVATNPTKDKECIATFGELYGFSVATTIIGLALVAIAVCFINGPHILRVLHPHLG